MTTNSSAALSINTGKVWKDGNPLFAGDTLYSESEVLEKRESKSKPQWGIIKVRTRGLQQDGKIVIDYARNVMVWKRTHAPKKNIFPEASA